MVRRDRHQSVDRRCLRHAGHIRAEPRRHGARHDERDPRQPDGLHARVRDGRSAAHVGHGVLAVERDLSPRQRQRLRNPLGATPNPALPPMSIANPDHVYTGPVNFIVTQQADGEVDNRAAYVFDRVQLTERFEINAGLRYEHNEASSTLGEHRGAVSGAAGRARRHADAGRRERRRPELVPRRLRVQAERRTRASTSRTATRRRRRNRRSTARATS